MEKEDPDDIFLYDAEVFIHHRTGLKELVEVRNIENCLPLLHACRREVPVRCQFVQEVARVRQEREVRTYRSMVLNLPIN